MRQLEGAYYDAAKIQLSQAAHRPHAVLQRRERRDARRCRAAPTRSTSTSRSRRSRPARCCSASGFSTSTKLVAVRLGLAGERVRHRQVPVRRGQQRQGQQGPTALSYLDPVLHRRRRQPGLRHLHAQIDASSLSVGAYKTDTLGGGVKFGFPVTETDSINFGLIAGARQARACSTTARRSTSNFVSDFGDDYTYAARQRRLGARHARQRDPAHAAARCTRARRRARRRRPAVLPPQPTPPVATIPLTRTMHARAAAASSAMPTATAASRCRSSRTSTPAARTRCAATRPFSLGPQDAVGNVLGGNAQIVGNAEVLFPVPGAEQGQVAAAGRVRRCRPGLRREREVRPQRAALLRRPRHCAGSRRSARCACPSRSPLNEQEGRQGRRGSNSPSAPHSSARNA